jgi:hypothetical protein
MRLNRDFLAQVLRCSAIAFLLPGLSSCGGMAQMIKTNLEESKKIAERCDMVQAPFQASNEQLARRLRTVLTFQTQGANNICATAMDGHLEALLKLKALDPNTATGLAKGLAERLDTHRTKINTATTAIKASLDNIETKLPTNDLCRNRRECATRLALLLDDFRNDVSSISNNLQELHSTLDTLVADLALAQQAFRSTGNDLAFSVAQAERDFRVMQRLVETAQRITTDGDYDLIITAYVDSGLLAIFDKTARATIKQVIRTMAPLERSIDAADNKTYGLISLGHGLFQGSLQGEIDRAAGELLQRIEQAAQKSETSLDEVTKQKAHLSLARASCEKLLGPTSELDDAFLSPFLLKAIINTFSDRQATDLNALVVNNQQRLGSVAPPIACNTNDAAAVRFVESYVGLSNQLPESPIRFLPTVLNELKLRAMSQTAKTVRADTEQAVKDVVKSEPDLEPVWAPSTKRPLSPEEGARAREALNKQLQQVMSQTSLKARTERIEQLTAPKKPAAAAP